MVNFVLTNNSTTDRYVLKYSTPFDGIQGDLFEVIRDGVKVPYLGAVAKRAAPGKNDYFLLKAGKSYTQKFDLATWYDTSVSGDYKIRFRSVGIYPAAAVSGAGKQSSAAPEMVQSATLPLSITGRLPRGSAARAQVPQTTLAGSLTTLNCTATQTTTITTAFGSATTLATQSAGYFAAGNADLRYKTWFGNYDATRYALGKSHFDSLQDAFTNRAVSVNCSCDSKYANAFAYVYPADPYKIYVCNAFWSAANTGTDSRSGTLIHEMSHFTAVAGTLDTAYGQESARALAMNNPAAALTNADSHEYFAENTPASTSALFTRTRASYTITKSGAGFLVVSPDANEGTQFFSSITRLRFTDFGVAFDIEGNAGKAYRLYQAAFNRVPDLGGLGFWIGRLDAGDDLAAVAGGFINSQEFIALYGANPTNDVFLTKLYNNVLHRAPDAGGYSYWMNLLNSGYPRANVLASFSESAENKAQVLPAIGNGITYTPY